MNFLLILNVVLHLLGLCEGLRTVNGLINGSVTLTTGSLYTSPTEVRWTIKKAQIATYILSFNFTKTDTKRFGQRLYLNKEDGSLKIKQVQKTDADTYNVEVIYNEGKHTDEVKLMIYEKADTPKLEVLYNVSEPGFCNVSVRCAALNGLWVVSLCEFVRGKLVCRDTARNDSAHSASLSITATNDTSASLSITATNDSINCSSSNPASTSSAPLLPVTHICNIDVPGGGDDTHRFRYLLIFPFSSFGLCCVLIGLKTTKLEEPETDSNDLQPRKPSQSLTDLEENKNRTEPNDLDVREATADPQGNNQRTDKTGS